MSRFTATRLHLNKNTFKSENYGQEWEDYKRNHPLKFARCETPNCRNKAQERHHIVPVRKNGGHVRSNILNLCAECHKKRHPHMQRKSK